MKNIFFYLFICVIISIGCKKEVLYTLNVSVTPSGSGTTSITSGSYQAGQSVSITATPAPEYIFKGWSGSLTSDNNPLTVVMDSSKSIVANFEKRQYPLSLTIEGSGVVKEEIVLTQAKVGSYPSGTTVKLTAIPDTGWKFDSWSGDTSLTVNPFTINFKKSYSIKAKFIKPISYSYLSSNQIRLLAKEYIDVRSFDKNTNCWSYGDFDSDGDEDIFVGAFTSYPFMLINNNGGYSRNNSFIDTNGSYTIHPRSLIEGDFNNDGYLDIITLSHNDESQPNNPGENVLLFINNKGKLLKSKVIINNCSDLAWSKYKCDTRGFWHLGSAADIDGDKDLDLLLSTAGSQYIYINDGNANFTKFTKTEPGIEDSHLIGGMLEDINSDGYTDFLTFGHEFANLNPNPSVYHNGPKNTTIMWGNKYGNLLFSNSKIISTDTTGFALCLDALNVDLDGDNKKEIILLRTGDPEKFQFYKGYKINVYSGIDYSDITEKLFGKIEDKNSDWIYFLRVKDLNGDGKLDICDFDSRNINKRFLHK